MRYPFLLFALCAALCFVACTENNSTQRNAISTHDATNSTDITPISTLDSSRIDTSLVKTMLADFETMSRDHSDTAFVCGFLLNHGDLQALVADRDTTNQDTIYAMIGYNKDSVEFDLIFCLETPINSGNFEYYDFTAPCPDFCPDYAANCAPPTIAAIAGNMGYWFGRAGISHFLRLGTGANEKVYFMLPGPGKEDEGILMVECDGDCKNPSEMWQLGPCGQGSIPCHEVK